MSAPRSTDFDDWLVETFAQVGSFTVLIVLVDITPTTVEPLSSSYLHIIGDETRWPDMVSLFTGSGAAWNGAAFFRADRSGLVADAVAKARLGELTRALHSDRALLQQSDFFNAQGLRLQIEEVKPPTAH